MFKSLAKIKVLNIVKHKLWSGNDMQLRPVPLQSSSASSSGHARPCLLYHFFMYSNILLLDLI